MVEAEQKVWLSWVFQNNPGIRYAIGKPGRAQSSGTWSEGMPYSFGDSGMGDYNYSIYCSFSPLPIEELIGISEVYSSVSTAPNRRAIPLTCNEAGTIESISIYHNGGAGNLLMGVYTDRLELPCTQIGKTASTVINSTPGWQTVSLVSPVTVEAGQKVWLSWVFQNNPGIRYAIGKPGRAQSACSWYEGMPSSFGESSMGDYNYSVYCTIRTNKGSALSNENVSTKSGLIPEDNFAANNVISDEQIAIEKDIFKNLKIDLYPNPANNIITIRFSELPDEMVKIIIFDMTGREMLSRIVQNTQETFDIEDLKPGMYLVKTELSNSFRTQKLIKR
jgi:hypothetical protein